MAKPNETYLEEEQERINAVNRYQRGERSSKICKSLGRSRSWPVIEQNPPSGRIFLTDIPEEWRIRRFVESSLEASKKLKIRKCERSEHFRYIKLYLIYYKNIIPGGKVTLCAPSFTIRLEDSLNRATLSATVAGDVSLLNSITFVIECPDFTEVSGL